MGRGLYRRRPARARKLCEPDPHPRWRHARQRPARRAVSRRQELHRTARAAAQRRQAHARRRVRPRQLRALGQGARPAISGANQGAPEQPRRAAPGVRLRAPRAGAVAQRPCGARQAPGRAGHPRRANAPARQPESGKAQRQRRGRAARQAHRLRKPRHRPQRNLSGRRRQRRRQRQDGPRQGNPGHPALARQSAQHLGSGARPAVQKHRNPRYRRGAGRRPARRGRHPRPLGPALRQSLHPL